MFIYNGPIPLMLMLADETTLLALTDENNVPIAVIETGNENVRSWVEDRLDRYRAQSVQVTADDLPG